MQPCPPAFAKYHGARKLTGSWKRAAHLQWGCN